MTRVPRPTLTNHTYEGKTRVLLLLEKSECVKKNYTLSKCGTCNSWGFVEDLGHNFYMST